MTEQEATMIVQAISEKIWNQMDKAEEEAIAVAIKALEKQIPKKPDIEGDGYDPDGNLVYDTWICPNCEEHYEIDYDYYDYCPKCGQSIDNSFRDLEVDWSDEE